MPKWRKKCHRAKHLEALALLHGDNEERLARQVARRQDHKEEELVDKCCLL